MDKGTKWLIGGLIVFFVFMCMATANGGTTKDYTVQPGDSWYSIAEAQGVDIDELLRANGATKETMLYPDQVIKIPIHNNNASQSEAENGAAEKPQWMEQNPE